MINVGREPVGNNPVKIMDAEEKEMERGQVGEIWASTPMPFSGYWNGGAWEQGDHAAGMGYPLALTLLLLLLLLLGPVLWEVPPSRGAVNEQ